MTDKYQIFTSLESIEQCDLRIDELLGYKNTETKTDTYRVPEKHQSQDLWCGVVDDELVNACAEMNDEECLQYYDRENVIDEDYLRNNSWFDEEE